MASSKSLRPPLRSIVVPFLVGSVLAIVATVIANKAVAPAIAAKGGWYSRWDQSFVGMCGALAFFLGFFISLRFLRGPKSQMRSWMLSMEQVVAGGNSYWEDGPPRC